MCGTVFALDSASSVSCMCMCVCTVVGMCSPSVVPRRGCVYACVVQYMAWAAWAACGVHEYLRLHVRTVLVSLAQCLWN